MPQPEPSVRQQRSEFGQSWEQTLDEEFGDLPRGRGGGGLVRHDPRVLVGALQEFPRVDEESEVQDVPVPAEEPRRRVVRRAGLAR
ncbi:hypothetical protein [Kineococcus sp. NPDC059986]|uniref:hypothetical protein n=1 Tax=Kineococcus sp. NPDC059986 TaxID=3155538 RepID=UPI00344C6FF0